MENSPISKSGPEIQTIFGQFVVQKSAFFGLVRRILVIKEDRLELNSLNFDAKHSEVFYFSEITLIQVAPENETQFILTFKKNQTLTFYSEVRTQCLCEIYRAWDKNIVKKGGFHSSQYPSYHGLKLITPGDKETYIETELVVYRTYLEMRHLELVQSSKKTIRFEKIEGTDNLVNPIFSIPFYLIRTLYKTHVGLVVEMADSLAKHEFIFYDMEKTNNLISRIQSYYKDHTGHYLEINDKMFDQGLILETVVPKSYELFFFHTKVLKILESGHLMPIRLALSDNYIVEIDIEEELVLQKYDIASIRNIVRMVTGFTGIQVIFEDLTVLTYAPPLDGKGLLASNLFTLANWKKNSQVYSVQNDFIHSMIPKYNYRVEGWINNDVEFDYENELIKRFSRSQADDDRFFGALHEFNLNAHLKTYSNTDNGPLKLLIQLFNKNLKIIMTPEFISYWETYQLHISNRIKHDVSLEGHQPGRAFPTDDKSPSSKSSEEKLKNLLNKYQFEIAEKFPNTRFSIKTLPLMLYRTEELLKGITLLVSSKGLFKELAVNKKESSLYEAFIIDVTRLLNSPYSTLSHLAGCFFRALLRFSDNTELKAESNNKSFLLSSKINLMQIISGLLAKRVLVKNQEQKDIENIYILSILACLRILKSFVHERKETTSPEDLQMILGHISKPYYFAIFNFLSRYRSIACVYNTTIILNSFFKNCTSRELYKSLQTRFLNNSSLILLHIVQVLTSLAVLQRKISVILLSHLFFDNVNACGLVCRIFPKNLFRKVDFMSNDITKWTLQQWEQFFSLVVKDFNTTTEIWTEECREELLSKLRLMDHDINSKFNFCPANRLQELFAENSDEGEFLLNIRWNYEEYEVRYDFLQSKIPVGKYYLTTLLSDSDQPRLDVKVTNPSKLWNDLCVKFIGTKKVEDMAIILKTMILIYKEYNLLIKDLDTMNHWLKCLEIKEYKRVWYLILQLLYTSLAVEDVSLSRLNIKNFVDSDGIPILANVLQGLYFLEDHDSFDEETEINYQQNIREDMDYNYTTLNLAKQAYTSSLEKSCMISFIINIYRNVLIRYKDQKLNKQVKFVYPIPTGKSHILEKLTLQSIVNVLLLKDSDLAIDVLEFFTESLCDRFTFKFLTEGTPIYEILLFNLNYKTVYYKCKLLYEFYCRVTEEHFGKESSVLSYLAFTFKSILPETVDEALSQFPILRYLPKHFIWKITKNDLEEFRNIFFSESYETPQLIWNSEMREQLAEDISSHFQGFIQQLVAFSESDEKTKEQMPQYSIGAFDIKYKNIEDEVYCGPMFLRVWVSKSAFDFKIPAEEAPIFLKKLNNLLIKYVSKPLNQETAETLRDLLIVLKAQTKAIKVFSLVKYKCFEEILTILRFLPEKISHWNPIEPSKDQSLNIAEYIQTLCRLIFRAIRLENSENAQIFAKTKGIEVFILILKSLVQRINVAKKMETYDDYADLQVTYEDLKILDLIIRIIVKMLQKCYDEFAATAAEVKLQLFIDLLVVSKIPLILFEFVRNMNIQSKIEREINESIKKKSISRNNYEPFEKVAEEPFENDEEVIELPNQSSTSVFDVISANPESPESEICIMKIFIITKNLLDLLTECSLDATYITTFVQSGLAWRFLEFLTYYNDIGEATAFSANPNFQTMLINIEKICNIWRNLVMYGNEAFIWKLVDSPSGSNEIEIIKSSQDQTSEGNWILAKLDSPQKDLLSEFFKCVLRLNGKRLVQLLLANYSQPRVVPKEKDLQSIARYLKSFSTELSEATDLWNEETRNELKALLIKQINETENSNGENYLNLIQNFRFNLHQRNLIIGDIFVSQYNKAPEWKIQDPAHFITESLRAISVFRNSLAHGKPPTDFIVEEVDENCLFMNIEQALLGILNATIYNDSNSILLDEKHLTQLASLLDDSDLQKKKAPVVSTLKLRVLEILLHISKVSQEAQRLLTNVIVVRNTLKILRGNTKESVQLYPTILKFIHSMTHDAVCRNALLNYGFYLVLLESIVKVEIYPSNHRATALDILMKVLGELESGNILAKKIIHLFPLHIQQKISEGTYAPSLIELLDKGYDTPKAMWTDLMRKEVLVVLGQECDEVQQQWKLLEGCNFEIEKPPQIWDSRILIQAPIFPEVEESINIDDIFLNNFNKLPIAERNINLPAFTDHIALYVQDLFGSLVEQSKKATEFDMNTEPKNEEIEAFKNTTSKFITLLTSLILATDQLLSEIKARETIPYQQEEEEKKVDIDFEVKEASPEEEVDSVSSHAQQELSLSDNVLSCILKCTELFSNPLIHPHILSLELQLIFLVLENQKGFTFFKNHHIIHFLKSLLLKVSNPQSGQSPFHHVEEKLILCILLKLVLKDLDLVAKAIDECVEPLRDILLGKKHYLNPYVDQIITVLSRHPEKGKEAFSKINKGRALITLAIIHDCMPATFLSPVWRTCSGGWNPYRNNNTLNILYQEEADVAIEYPLVSEYAIFSFLHPNKRNSEIQRSISEYIGKIQNEYENSVEAEVGSLSK